MVFGRKPSKLAEIHEGFELDPTPLTLPAFSSTLPILHILVIGAILSGDKLMYVKIMAGDSLPDNDPKKCFTLYADVDLVNFLRDKEGGPEIEIVNGPQTTNVKLSGNVYCLGDMGANIARFAVKDDDLFYDPDEVEIF